MSSDSETRYRGSESTDDESGDADEPILPSLKSMLKKNV